MTRRPWKAPTDLGPLEETVVPSDVFRRSADWDEISRADALGLFARHRAPTVVVYRHGGMEHADWFTPHHPYASGFGPHGLVQGRYFRLRVVRPRREGQSAVDAVSPEPVATPRPMPARPRPAPEKTWVEVELVDDDGQPVPNAPYKIRLPDGTTHQGTLDGRGRARFDGIDGGNCDISFTDIDAKEWSFK